MKTAKKGFTLIEVIAVVCIIGMLASLIVPKIQKHMDDANETKYYIDAKTINQCVDMYNVENMDDQITYDMALNEIKQRLLSDNKDDNKKYITKWPAELKVKVSQNTVQTVDDDDLNRYTYGQLCSYIETREVSSSNKGKS